MSKKRMITKSVIFLLILAFILKIFSSLSIAMGYNANPLYNYSSYSIFQEPDNSIDVLLHRRPAMYTAAFSLSYGGNNRDLPDIPGDSQASVSRKLTNI